MLVRDERPSVAGRPEIRPRTWRYGLLADPENGVALLEIDRDFAVEVE